MKLIKSIVAAALAITLCSCRISPYTLANKQANGVTQETSLTIILHEGENSFLDSAARAYSGSHPQVQISILRLADDQNYNAEVLAHRYSDQKPTAFAVNGERDLNFWKEDLLPLPFDWMGDANSALTGPVAQGGSYYAFPLDLIGYGIVYESELLTQLGIDSSALNTWEGLSQVVEALKGHVGQPDSKLVSALCPEAQLSPFAPVGEDRNTLRLGSLGGLQGVVDLLPAAEQQSAAQLLADGSCALAIASSDLVAQVREISKERANSLRIAPLALDGQAATSLTIGCSYLAVNKTAGQAEQNAMLDFLNWLYTSPEGQEVLSSCGVVSPYSDTSSSALQSSLYSYLRTERAVFSKQGCFPSGWASEAFDDAIGRYRSGALAWDDTIREIEENWGRRTRD